MALQTWQTAFVNKPQNLMLLQIGLQVLRPIVDGRVNSTSRPAYYDEHAADLTGMNTVLSDSTVGRDYIECYPNPGDLQFLKLYGVMHSLWFLLRPYTQGKSIQSCDAVQAELIQELFNSVTAPAVPVP